MAIDLDQYDAVTFDCYGTLIDWDTGVANVLGPWAAHIGFQGRIADLIECFSQRQQEQQRIRPALNYREVIREAFRQAAADFGAEAAAPDLDAFCSGVGDWPAFPDTVDALRDLKARGLHLGVVSNVDNASFRETQQRLGHLIDTIVTAETVGAYKPDLEMFEALFAALKVKGVARTRILHVAQSRFHDIAPGAEIGLDVIWIDRRHGRPGKGATIPAEATPLERFTSLEEFCGALQRKDA